LNGCMSSPRALSAAQTPILSVVLPEDLCAAEKNREAISVFRSR
jgi:hypothetical protein